MNFCVALLYVNPYIQGWYDRYQPVVPFKELNRLLHALFVMPSYLTCAYWSVVALYQSEISSPVVDDELDVNSFCPTSSNFV